MRLEKIGGWRAGTFGPVPSSPKELHAAVFDFSNPAINIYVLSGEIGRRVEEVYEVPTPNDVAGRWAIHCWNRNDTEQCRAGIGTGSDEFFDLRIRRSQLFIGVRQRLFGCDEKDAGGGFSATPIAAAKSLNEGRPRSDFREQGCGR